MKSKKISKIIFPIFLLIIIVLFLFIFVRAIKRPLKIEDKVVVTINEGDTFYSVLDKFSNENIISSKPLIKLYLKLSNKSLDVKPGEYELLGTMSVNEIIDTLTEESTENLVKFTVPEGFTVDDIAKKLDTEGICSKNSFIDAVKAYNPPSFVKKNDGKRYNLEGYLFPDTYIINKNYKPSEIVDMMVSRFKEVWSKALDETKVIVKDEDIERIVTIASMIEKEARIDKERPIIASVIFNRLNIDMKLQIDATVIYAMGEHVEKVLYSHLKTDSPYNTYKNYGLPIGPICNPGLSSIKAALKPEKTDYLFYVLQKDGTHYFTNNYDDFIKKQHELGY